MRGEIVTGMPALSPGRRGLMPAGSMISPDRRTLADILRHEAMPGPVKTAAAARIGEAQSGAVSVGCGAGGGYAGERWDRVPHVAVLVRAICYRAGRRASGSML
jgi:hypothetical protein